MASFKRIIKVAVGVGNRFTNYNSAPSLVPTSEAYKGSSAGEAQSSWRHGHVLHLGWGMAQFAARLEEYFGNRGRITTQGRMTTLRSCKTQMGIFISLQIKISIAIL